MKQPKPLNNQNIDRPNPTDWFSFITDDRVKLVVPVGPRFQVEVPSWTLASSRSPRTSDDGESDSSKWKGSPIWPVKGRSQDTNNRRHVSNKIFQLQVDLGPAFWKWKFDEMGEDVSRLWNPEEQQKFEYIVKMKATSQGKSFIDSTLECFPGQSKGSIVSYYLNVYIPRRVRIQTRLSCAETVDTDDEAEDRLRLKGSHKRFQANGFTSSSRKYLKTTACLTAHH